MWSLSYKSGSFIYVPRQAGKGIQGFHICATGEASVDLWELVGREPNRCVVTVVSYPNGYEFVSIRIRQSCMVCGVVV